MASYLFRRQGVYYFRLVIPSDQRHEFGGKCEIRRSLSTYNRQVALTAAAGLLIMAKKRIYQKNFDGIHSAIRKMDELEGKFDPDLRYIKVKQGDADITIDTGDIKKDIEAAKSLLDPTYKPVHTDTEDTTLLSEAIATFCQEKNADGSWGVKTAEESRMIYGVMVEIIGDIPASKLDHKIARFYKKVLLNLPPNHKKVPQYADLSIDQILATKPKKTLATYTVNKHLSRANMLCDWLWRHGYVKANYFKKLNLKNNKRRADEERDVFNDDDLKKIFAPRKKYLYPYYYWIPYLCLYTGARLNELCQLYVSDVYKKDGAWIIDINDDAYDKRLKNRSSKRLVPIHSRLIELGFLDFVKSKMKSKRIFDELPYRRDSYGQDVSRWFSRWRKDIGVSKPLHSFRHLVANTLKQKLVDTLLIKAILGHADESTTTGRYGKQYDVRLLKETIEQLEYNI